MTTELAVSTAALAELRELLERCADEGLSFDMCHRELLILIQRHDWHWFAFNKVECRQRAMVLYKVVSAGWYAAGRKSQLIEESWAYWVFAAGCECPVSHVAMDGATLPPSDTFWLDHMPPLDWDCGCYVLGARSMRGAHRLGGKAAENFDQAALRRDVRGRLWRSEEPPDLLQLLRAVVTGEGSASTAASRTSSTT